MNKRRGKKVTIAILLLVAGFVVGVQAIKAGNSQSGIGWLWGGTDSSDTSPSTFGWISMNSRDCDTDGDGAVSAAEAAAVPGCPVGAVPDYGVAVPETNGPVTGYAWSEKRNGNENYGWLSFNPADVAGCPIGACSAQRVGSSLTGWARILSIRDNPFAGGWSGFVSLDSGTTGSGTPYGVTVSGNNLSGYAWSDELGWIDFSGAKIDVRPDVQICESSCTTGTDRTNGVIAMLDNDPAKNLYACYGKSTMHCSDPSAIDVTSNALTTWAITANPDSAISLTGTSPKVLDTNTLPTIGTRAAAIQVTYNGTPATLGVNVSKYCASNCSADAANHCRGTSFNATDSCGISEVCPGTRYCDTNYKEVQP